MVPKMRQYLILATAQGCNEAGAGGLRGERRDASCSRQLLQKGKSISSKNVNM